MEYASAKPGRVFIVKFGDGDDVLKSIYRVLGREKVSSGLIFLIGAIKDCRVVAGPKKTAIPPDPWFMPVKGAHEVVGMGTVIPLKGEPKVHLHMGLGRGSRARVGCLRAESKTYLVLEGIIMELKTKAVREMDKASGMALLKIIR
jgi:uncharacterized protein